MKYTLSQVQTPKGEELDIVHCELKAGCVSFHPLQRSGPNPIKNTEDRLSYPHGCGPCSIYYKKWSSSQQFEGALFDFNSEGRVD